MSLRTLALGTAVLVLALATATPATAYDSGPHADVTQDALTTEGFGRTATNVARVNNWFVDIYEQADSNPFTGHGGFWKRLLSGALLTESWPQELIDAAGRSHFDSSTSTLFNSAGVANEWDRLQRAVWTLAREARDAPGGGDPLKLLTVLGASIHQVQDFYTHTNWVEPEGQTGFEGPGWKARGYGSTPTWFDVPPAAREAVTIYTANTQGHPRQHGDWNDDDNASLTTAMAKDWPGRPLYTESATAAYFATRQWIRAVRSWVADEGFWRRTQRYAQNRRQLGHDLRGALYISLYSGHWQGQGEPLGGERGPGGSLLDLRSAIKAYFQTGVIPGLLRGRTVFRRQFEQTIRRMAAPAPAGEVGPVPSSQDLQRSLRLIRMKVNYIRGLGLGDPGPDEADNYVLARIGGQAFRSANIEGEDSFSFRPPNFPHTFLKAVPAAPAEGEPVESIEVEVKTGDVRYAGTDDDVFLRVSPTLRFNLDKRLYDDFERGDRDTYSVPIDEATRDGLRVGDIRQVQIEKASDGAAGGWRLGGVTLKVNGRVALPQRRGQPVAREQHPHVARAELHAAEPARAEGAGVGAARRGGLAPRRRRHRRHQSIRPAPRDQPRLRAGRSHRRELHDGRLAAGRPARRRRPGEAALRAGDDHARPDPAAAGAAAHRGPSGCGPAPVGTEAGPRDQRHGLQPAGRLLLHGQEPGSRRRDTAVHRGRPGVQGLRLPRTRGGRLGHPELHVDLRERPPRGPRRRTRAD